MMKLTSDALLESVRSLFKPAVDKSEQNSRSIGAELEMIPVTKSSGHRVLAKDGHPSGSDFIASIAAEFAWQEEQMPPDPSCWSFQDGRMSFEPGGQIELSSAVYPTASSLLRAMEKWTGILVDRAAQSGILLRTIGVDDRTPITGVPLQLQRKRYRAMTEYFDSVGPFGVLMMRQTASLQINVDRGAEPLERWRLLNALAPYMVAIFANSPRYEGGDTGHKSYRAHIWRMLDPLRTGVAVAAEDPAKAYCDFALRAPAILFGSGNKFPTFQDLVDKQSVTMEDWDTHLSTLFPEVRPREYFEIRSTDAIDPLHVCAAIAFVVGLVYGKRPPAELIDVIGTADNALLARAGQFGLDDSEIRAKATLLSRFALKECETLGTDYISGADIAKAGDFFARYTLRGRSPADDLR
jgi:glutamate--cysteine ligase